MVAKPRAIDRKTLPEYPFDIGTRWVKDGREWVQIPLTEEDFLHPEEEDQFVCTDAHSVALMYLRHAIEVVHQGRPELRVFSDHRTDWEEPDVRPMRPDVVVYDHFEGEWDPHEGTLPVHEVDAVPLLVVEVTSPSTRHVDLGRKPVLYDEAKVPYFLVFDYYAAGGTEVVPELLGFRRTKRGYVRMKADPEFGVWVPTVGMWFRFDGDRTVALNAKKERIPTPLELAQQLEEQTARAEAEKQRAEAEKQRAEAEKQRAEAEKQRADALERELAELRTKLATPTPKKNGHK